VWIANGNNSVSALTEAGTAVTSTSVPVGGTAIAIDNAGDVWSLNKSASSVAEFTNLGSVISSGYTAGGINTPTALAIDGAGQVWVTNGNNTLSVLSSTGTAVSSTPYTSVLSTPTSINVDGSGNLWITNSGSNSVTQVIGVAAPVTTPETTAVKNSSLASRP
jgi:ligand-binding sensor domain-containing protein